MFERKSFYRRREKINGFSLFIVTLNLSKTSFHSYVFSLLNKYEVLSKVSEKRKMEDNASVQNNMCIMLRYIAANVNKGKKESDIIKQKEKKESW